MLTIAPPTGTAGNWTSSVKASEIDHWCTNKQGNIEGTTNIIHIEGKCYFEVVFITILLLTYLFWSGVIEVVVLRDDVVAAAAVTAGVVFVAFEEFYDVWKI